MRGQLPETVQALLISGLLIIPGFIHYRLASAQRVWASDEKFEISVTLTSLALTTVLMSAELLGLGLLATTSDTIHGRLSEGFKLGLQGYAETYPSETLIGLTGVLLTNSVLLGLAGAYDPEGTVVELLRRRRRTTQRSAWYRAFVPERVEKKRKDCTDGRPRDAIIVYMKGETLPRYFGWSGPFDLGHDGQGDFYFHLWNPQRLDENGEWKRVCLHSDYLSGVLLKTSEIAAVEFTYGDVEVRPPVIKNIVPPAIKVMSSTL